MSGITADVGAIWPVCLQVLGMIPLARELLCMGADVVMVANSQPAINDITAPELLELLDGACAPICPIIAAARKTARRACARTASGDIPPFEPRTSAAAGGPAATQSPQHERSEPALYVCGSGSAGPCLDLARISSEVASACDGVDLIVIEGMGRAVHTNMHALFTCPVLKLAMIKVQRVAERLFDGSLFDCMCRFDAAVS